MESKDYYIDRATYYVKSDKVKIFIKEQKENLILYKPPKRLPEFNPMEEE